MLKIHYLCGWNDNTRSARARKRKVVICSKFITFVVEMTTCFKTLRHERLLWFAQNSLPLWLKWQPWDFTSWIWACCDLLKIHYLCGWNDNVSYQESERLTVVICSKFITFVVEMTTSLYEHICILRLWFAQNSLPLWLKWQQII